MNQMGVYVDPSASPAQTTASLAGSNTASSNSPDSISQVKPRVSCLILDRELQLRILCGIIESHQPLGQAKIISTEAYAVTNGVVTHRFVLLELRCLDFEVLYLRLDRRRDRNMTIPSLLANAGRARGNDVGKISSSKTRLIEGVRENRQTFDISPTLGDLNPLLRAVCQKVRMYELWPANCWAFVCLLQQYLHVTHCGAFVDGKLHFLPLANNVFRRIRNNLKQFFPLTEILRSLHRMESHFPARMRRNISEVLELSKSWDGSGNYDTVPGRILAHKLAESTQDVARRLNSDAYADHTRVLWEESLKLVEALHKHDPEPYREQFAVSLHHYGVELCRTGEWEEATHVARGAVCLQRRLYEGCSESTRHSANLAASLGAMANSLRKLGRVDEAQVATKEMFALQRQLYLGRSGIRGIELTVFLRGYGRFLGRPQSHLACTRLAGERGRMCDIARS